MQRALERVADEGSVGQITALVRAPTRQDNLCAFELDDDRVRIIMYAPDRTLPRVRAGTA